MIIATDIAFQISKRGDIKYFSHIHLSFELMMSKIMEVLVIKLKFPFKEYFYLKNKFVEI